MHLTHSPFWVHPRYGLFLLTAMQLVSCGSEQDSGQNNSHLKESRHDAAFEEADKQDVAASDTSQGVFADVCAVLATLTLNSNHKSYEDAFCSGGKAKPLLATRLPKRSFSGDGDVKLLKLGEVASDTTERTTSLTVAGAVKLTVSAERYFTKMTEFMDNRAAAEALGIKLISSGSVTEETLQTFQGAALGKGPGLIKGWEKRVKIINQVSGQAVTSEYEYRADHFELIPGKAYLIDNGLTKSIEGVKDSAMFVLVVQNGSDALVLSQLYTKTDNKGLPSVALDTLTKLFKEGLGNAYENSRKIGSAP